MTPPIWDHGMGMFDMKVETNQSNLVVSYGCFQLTNLDAHRSMDPPFLTVDFHWAKIGKMRQKILVPWKRALLPHDIESYSLIGSQKHHHQSLRSPLQLGSYKLNPMKLPIPSFHWAGFKKNLQENSPVKEGVGAPVNQFLDHNLPSIGNIIPM